LDENPETQLGSLDEKPTPVKKSRRLLWLILGVVVVLVLGAAAFLGGRYMQNGSLSTGGSNGGTLLSSGQPAGSVRRQFINNELIPAPELPKRAADVTGIFDHRQNNSFFVGTGQLLSGSYDGPVVEVVVANNTKVYKDDSLLNPNNLPSNGTKFQQKVVPGNLDEIGQDSLINAWGRKTGNRLIADVLVYNNPNPMIAPGQGLPGAGGK
jgi:hypothetical protein